MIPYTTHPEAFIAVSAKKVIVIVIVIVSMLALISCSVTKTIPVETIKEISKVDTIYLSNIQYDSIYINNVSYTDRTSDTLLIRETNTEFRYKLLQDTVERIKVEIIHDSIPYEVVVYKDSINHKPSTINRLKSWFDHLCRYAFFLMCGALLILAYKTIRKFWFLS